MITKETKIVLASKSPRRKDILASAGYTFDILPSSFEMDINKKDYSDSLLLQCVCGKIASLSYEKIYREYEDKYPDLLFIAADTVVVLSDKIIGKPKDEVDAKNILKSLSGKTHFVATGLNIVYTKNNKTTSISDIEKTYVTFRELSTDDIDEYIKSAKPFDKAGAYGIQDPSFNFATHTNGNIDNVIGFPMTLFSNLLRNLD